MLNSIICLPPSSEFWTQCAARLIHLMQPGGALHRKSATVLAPNAPNALNALNEFSALRVIVPAFEHAQLLTKAMSTLLGGHFIPPRINTMSGWLAMQVPVPNVPKPIAEGERLMALYAQLREHAWLKKLFSARKNTDLLPLAQTLLTLCDELTEAMLPLVLNEGVDQAERIWHQALASLPSQHVLSDEAQLVWKIWISQMDGQDAISIRFQHMLRLAENSTEALLWLSPVAPKDLDQQFLTAYAKKNPVQVISIDWRAQAISPTLGTIWQEIIEVDELNAISILGAQRLTSLFSPACGREGTHGTSMPCNENFAMAVDTEDDFSHVTTIAADSLEQEAQLAAQTILDFLQQGKSHIALIAQDRLVARRIRALLERAQVTVADETGWKLSTTRAASALAAWFDVVATRADTIMFLDLLKSPYFEPDSMSGFDDKSTWVMVIEMALLRANVVGSWESILYALQNTNSNCTDLVGQLQHAATRYSGRKNLSAWLEITRLTLDEFGTLTSWQSDSAGLQIMQLLDKLEDECAPLSEYFSFSEWRVFMNMRLESAPFQGDNFDQRVVMLPLNGARLRKFDAVLMAGCDAAHLPSQPKEVLFFTNVVRRECGLITREQRQRQQLRDFAEMLSTNSEVVLTWQRQQRGENNPVSPWIERLNLGLLRAGKKPLQARDVKLFEQSLTVIETQQPRPTAAHLQPGTLSASGYNSFLACPYQFFATRMLGLSPLDTLSDLPEKRDYGGWLHAILKTYHDTLKAQPELYPPNTQEALLRSISDDVFNDVVRKSPAALGYRTRWQKVIPAYIAWSQRRMEAGWHFELGEIWLEKQLEWEGGAIQLRGQIDRVDKNQAGDYAVLDYKTNPVNILSKKLADAEDQQLPFYGLLATQDSMSSAHYVALGMTNDKLADVEAVNYSEWQQDLKESIIQNMAAIGKGAELPAQGVSQVCQYCDVRGLCRKGAWFSDDR